MKKQDKKLDSEKIKELEEKIRKLEKGSKFQKWINLFLLFDD